MISASAKIILFGEHAVVYQQPAIAVPISSLRVFVDVSSNVDEFRIVAKNLNNQIIRLSDTDNPFIRLALEIAKQLGKALPAQEYIIDSQIPIASGLGSGAAIATALGRAIFASFGQTVSPEQLNPLIFETEKTYHGTPSGIDNTVIVYEKPIFFIRGKPIEIIPDFQPFHLVVANTGISAPTKESVGAVRALYEANPDKYQPYFDEIGHLARQGLQTMREGNWATMGRLMTRNHELLQKLTVSCVELDRLVDASLSAGALGAKLSGGGRGGNMIALVSEDKTEQVIQALTDAGAIHAFKTKVAP